jgi:predicted methyltransferase
MQRLYGWLVISAVLVTAGCGRSSEPTAAATAEPDTQPAAATTAAEPSAEQPVQNVFDARERLAGDGDEDLWRKPAVILDLLGVGPGMEVIDVMAGAGYYSELLSRVVGPQGHVIAYNNRPYAEYAGDKLAERYGGDRLPNVEQMTVETDELALAPASLDAAIFIMSYHDFYWRPADGSWPPTDPADFLRRLFVALRPGAVVIVEDHIANPGGDVSEVVGALHRIDPERVKSDFATAGFVFDGESDALRNPEDNHTLPVFDDAVRHRTDQFVYRFVKPAGEG